MDRVMFDTIMTYYCTKCNKETLHSPKLDLELNGQAKCTECETINDKSNNK